LGEASRDLPDSASKVAFLNQAALLRREHEQWGKGTPWEAARQVIEGNVNKSSSISGVSVRHVTHAHQIGHRPGEYCQHGCLLVLKLGAPFNDISSD